MIAQEDETLFANFFSYYGRLSRGQYFLGIAIALGLAVLAVAAFTAVLGSGARFLAIPLVLGFLWVQSLVTIRRLRDAGLPLWHYAIYGAGPIIWLLLTLDYIERIGFFVVVVLLAFLIVPGIFPRKSDDDELDPPNIRMD